MLKNQVSQTREEKDWKKNYEHVEKMDNNHIGGIGDNVEK